jgi:hypothetical protein
MHISDMFAASKKRPASLRIAGGLLGMLISCLFWLGFPDQVIFFEGGLLLSGGSVLHGGATYLKNIDVLGQTARSDGRMHGTLSRLLLLVAALAYGAGSLAWLAAVFHLFGFLK